MTYGLGTGNVHVTGRRVVATIVDGILFGILVSVIRALSGTGGTTSGFKLTTLSAGGNLLLLVIVLLYYVLLEGLTGRTVGKMVTGIRVVDEGTGTAPGLVKAALRTLLRIVDGFAGYLLGFIIVLASGKRRRLGDMAARTLVVRA